jgi:hypothetical protein
MSMQPITMMRMVMTITMRTATTTTRVTDRASLDC